MSDLGDLYQEVIIDHSRRPRNFGELEGATRTAEGFNPLCGDQLTLYVKLADGRIADIAFQGDGCAIAQASASLMTTALKGKSQDEALALFGRVHAMLTEGPNGEAHPAELGKLAMLSPGSGSSRRGSSAPPSPGCEAPSKPTAHRSRRSRRPWPSTHTHGSN